MLTSLASIMQFPSSKLSAECLVHGSIRTPSLFRESHVDSVKLLKLFVSLAMHLSGTHDFEEQMPNTLQSAHVLLWK